MLCSRFLQPPARTHSNAFHRASERVLRRHARCSTAGRLRGVHAPSRRSPCWWPSALWWPPSTCYGLVPKGFIPSQDTGQIQRHHRSSAGHLLRRHGAALQQQVAGHHRQGSQRRRVLLQRGRRRRQQRAAMPGASSVRLKPRAERKLTPEQIIERAAPQAERRFPASAPTCRIRRWSASAARQSRSLYQFTLQAPELDALYRAAADFEKRMRDDPRPDRRQQRSADLQPAGDRGYRPRPRLLAGRHRRRRSRTRCTTPTARARSPPSTRPPTITG